MIITSTQNNIVKELIKLKKDKSFIFLDNPKLINEAYFSGQKIIYLIKKEGYAGKLDYGGQIIDVSENVFRQFATTITSQGVVGVVKYESPKLEKPNGRFLVLDNVQDPGNVGTLIRSALGANFLDIYLLDSCRVSNDKLIRSSMGALFKTRIFEMSKEEFLNEYTKWNLPLYTCDMNGENVYTHNFENNCGIVIGNEGKGVSLEIEQVCSKTIKIPMMNNLESLNAAISGSIIMYTINFKN